MGAMGVVMREFRVLVTGSRDWRNLDAVTEALAFAYLTSGRDKRMVLVHGTAAGLDTQAATQAGERGWIIEGHPARWDTHTEACPDWHLGLSTCRMAGHRRNQEMVDKGADICLAFIRNNSKGATGCATAAKKAGIPVWVWRDDATDVL